MDIAIPYIHTGASLFGDDGHYVTQLSAALARLGHQVTFYGRRGDPALPGRTPSRPRPTSSSTMSPVT